jgi:hypothetical protein
MSEVLPYVYADFNAIEHLASSKNRAQIPLTGYGTLRSLAQQRLRLVNGMRLILFEPEDIECEGVAHFDLNRTDPVGRKGEWVVFIDSSKIRDCTLSPDKNESHPCVVCGTDLTATFEKAGRTYEETCPVCGTSVMAPLFPPQGFDSMNR